MSWSERQRRAIEARRKNLLVSAAAGSGKTAVLVERVIQRMLDVADPLDIDRLLVVTFTNAAALEMRERIAAALGKELSRQDLPPDRLERLERQLALLGSASISTIHSFCQSVVRQHFHQLNLDPRFRVASQAEADLLRRDVLEEVLEKRYAADDPAMFLLADCYGGERDDAELGVMIVELYEFSRSLPEPELWLQGCLDVFAPPEQASFDELPQAKLLLRQAQLRLGSLAVAAAELLELAELAGEKEVQLAQEYAAVIDELQAASTWSELERACRQGEKTAYTRLSGGKKDPAGQEARDAFKHGRDQLKKQLEKVYVLVDRPGEELLEDLRHCQPLMAALVAVTLEFASAFREAKASRNLLDFGDLEHFCLAVLRDGEGSSAAALDLQERFQEVMVDEYQDTNGVQEAILQCLCPAASGRLFLVGDVKQSIYRFRLAEPELFREKYESYPVLGEGYERIDLAQNFRSRANVLAGVNYLFRQLMEPQVAELAYGEAEFLRPGLPYPPCEGKSLEGPNELWLLEETGKEAAESEDDGAVEELPEGFAAEAALIARRLQKLQEEQVQVYDKGLGGYRPLAWRDVVVLLRSVRAKGPVLLEALREAGIPAYADVDEGYFREIEVEVLLAALAAVDNPRQDIPLAAFLRSPLVGCKAAELAEIRLASAERSDLWDAVTVLADLETEAGRKAAHAVELLEGWRRLARRRGVPELLLRIYRDTGYYEYVGGLPGGALRQANLRALYDRARQFESTHYRGLFRFLRFVEDMREGGADMAVARILGEQENVVRVMTIHKSKGLEFPVVVVADAGKQFNLQDLKKPVLFHKTQGLGPQVIDVNTRYRYPGAARKAVAHCLELETKAEELRVLYVALTRAREKLILTGRLKHADKAAANWCRQSCRSEELLPPGLIAEAKGYLDWLGPALVRHQAAGDLRRLGGAPQEECLLPDESSWEIHICPPAAAESTGAAALPDDWFCLEKGQLLPGGEEAQTAACLEWQYPWQDAVGKAAKLSVTEIKRRFADVDESARAWPARSGAVYDRPLFLQAQQGPKGGEYGVWMHTVMQHLPLEGRLNEEQVQSVLEELVVKEVLLPEQAAALEASKIAAFLESALGSRLLASSQVRREVPFSVLLPAEEFYPEVAGQEETVFVQGVADLLFKEGDAWILVDYKSDRGLSPEELASRYRLQLELYARALGGILRQPVKECWLYSFALGETILLEEAAREN